jgi:hypothetical protein
MHEAFRPFAPGENVPQEEARKRKSLTMPEIEAIAERPAVKAITAMEFVPVEAVKYGNQHARDTRVFGVSDTYDTVHDMYVTKGRFISVQDVNRGCKVVVLGADVQTPSFPSSIHSTRALDGRRFEVIGSSEDRQVPVLQPRQHHARPLRGGGEEGPAVQLGGGRHAADIAAHHGGGHRAARETLRRKRS